MSAKLTVKRGTTEKWKDASSNTLAPGQLGVEYLDNGYSRLKVGPNDAITPWGTINYLTPDASLYKDDSIGDSARSLTSAYIKTLNNLSTITTYYGTSSYINSLSITNTNIALRVNGSSNGNVTANIGTYSTYLSFHPSGNSQSYIGNPDSHWKVGYIDDITSNSINTNTIISGTIYPESHNTYALGSSSRTWNMGYVRTFRTKYIYNIDNENDTNGSGIGFLSDGSIGLQGTSIRPTGYTAQDIGTTSNPWKSIYIDTWYRGTGDINGGTSYVSFRTDEGGTPYLGISGVDISPIRTNTSISLGDTTRKWSALYAVNVYTNNGTVQTSDISAKSNIHYLDETPKKSRSISTTSNNLITTNDVLDFIKVLNPATFIYKDSNGDEVDEEKASPTSIQLGLIANDVKDHQLFKYVGVEIDNERIIEPAEIDEKTGEIIKEKVVEKYTTLGLQPIPLATAALTACKYLLGKTTYLEDKLNELESRIKTLEQL